MEARFELNEGAKAQELDVYQFSVVDDGEVMSAIGTKRTCKPR